VIIAAKDLWYPVLNATAPLADLRARVAAVCAAGPRPRFALVYGNLLDGLGLTMMVLPKDHPWAREAAAATSAPPFDDTRS
jgi:hypothetical protein